MKRNDLDPFITEPDDDTPADPTRCGPCGKRFGLGLDQVRRSSIEGFCTECVAEYNQAYAADRDFDQPEPDEPFDRLEDLGNVA